MKIRNKLALQFTIIVATILLFFSVGVYYFSSTFRKSDFLSRIEMRAKSNAKLLIDVKEVDYAMLRIIEQNTISTLFELQVLILNSEDDIVYTSSHADSSFIFPLKENLKGTDSKFYFKNGENEGLGFIYISDKGERFLVFAWAVDKIGLQQLEHLKLILMISFIVGIIIIAFAGSVYARRSLLPISNVIREVEKISVSNLNLRVNEGNGHDEIAQLAIKFNLMLQRLENAFRMQRNFVSNASHELRTPLTAITGQIEVALMGKHNSEEYENILNSLLEDIKSLNALSNGLLNLAQSSIDPLLLKISPVRIDELLFESKTMLQRRDANYIVQLDFSDMPQDDELLTIQGNHNLLLAAFNNLIDNACKFSDDHKASVKIGAREDKLCVEIIDAGMGIPEDEMDKIFEPFYRAKNSKPLIGHGIGLSLSKKIVELHRGELQIRSKENMGTTVFIAFEFK